MSYVYEVILRTNSADDVARFAAHFGGRVPQGNGPRPTEDEAPAPRKRRGGKAQAEPEIDISANEPDVVNGEDIANEKAAAAETLREAAPEEDGTGWDEEPATAPDEPVSDEALVRAANEAVATIGAGGAMQIKKLVAAKFTDATGTAASLKKVRMEDRPALVRLLNAIAAGTATAK